MLNLHCHFVTPQNVTLPGCHHAFPIIQSIFPSNSNHPQCRFIPSIRCPAIQSHLRETRHRSTCPWRMCIHTDALRYPRDIVQAQCMCTACRGNSGDHSCQAVYHRIKVMKITGCNNVTGLYNYEWEPYSVPVGCTCTQNRYN